MAFFSERLTITHRRVARLEDVSGGGGRTRTGDINLDNILKLIPGDIVALYLVGKDASVAPIWNVHWQPILFWACLSICILLRIRATYPATTACAIRHVNWCIVIATSIAFFFWAHAVSADGPLIPQISGFPASIFAALFGLVAPALVPAEPEPKVEPKQPPTTGQ